MRRMSVATPAQMPFAALEISPGNVCYAYGFHLPDMASFAVFLNDFRPRLVYFNNLRFQPQSENCRVPRAVLRLKVVFGGDVIMRDVAVVAVRKFSVRAMRPSSVSGTHNMTVVAGFRLVGKIRYGVR